MLAMPMMVQGATAPRLGVPIIVLASPWHDPTDTIIAAGGDPIGPTRALFGVFATSHDPEFRETLWAAGHVSFGSHALATLFLNIVIPELRQNPKIFMSYDAEIV